MTSNELFRQFRHMLTRPQYYTTIERAGVGENVMDSVIYVLDTNAARVPEENEHRLAVASLVLRVAADLLYAEIQATRLHTLVASGAGGVAN